MQRVETVHSSQPLRRRLVAIAAVLSILLVAILAAAHLSHQFSGEPHAGDCAICLAGTALHTVFVVVAALLFVSGTNLESHPLPSWERPNPESRRWRRSAPRAPPTLV